MLNCTASGAGPQCPECPGRFGRCLPLSDGGGDGGGGSAGHRGRGGAGHRGRGVVVIRGHEVVAVAAASLQKKGSRPCQANHRKGSEELHGD